MSGWIRWVIGCMVFFAGAINYLDRAALSVAAPLMSKDLGLDAAQLGVVFSTFFLGYTLFCFPGGALADRFGPKLVLFISMLLWSTFCGLTGAVTSFASLLIVRVLFGMAEGPYLSNSAKLIGAWFPPRQRATVLGITQAGPSLGGALGGPIVGFLALWAGWRISFAVTAAFGITWAIVWALIGSNKPSEHRLIGPEELADIGTGEAAKDSGPPLHSFRYYVTRPSFIGVAIGYFAYAYLLYFFISWFPSYLTSAQHMSIQRMAIASIIPWLLGALGQAIGGIVSDALVKRTGNALLARKLVASTGLLGATICIGAMGMLTLTPEQSIALMSAAIFLTNLTCTSYFGSVLDMIEPQRVGAVGGFIHLIANCAGIVGPAITGYLIQWTGAFSSAFLLAGSVSLLGALGMAVLVRGTPALGTSGPRLTTAHAAR